MKGRGIVIANVLMLWMGGTSAAQTPGPATADSRVFVDGALGADYDQTDFEPPGPAMARAEWRSLPIVTQGTAEP